MNSAKLAHEVNEGQPERALVNRETIRCIAEMTFQLALLSSNCRQSQLTNLLMAAQKEAQALLDRGAPQAQ